MSKILVTGGAGFIGSNLVDELIKQGDKVVVIDNLVNGKKEYINPKAKFEKLDIADKMVRKVFEREKFDLVFHLAAQMDVRVSVEDPVFDNQVNVIGGYNVLKNCRDFNIKKIIFASTGGAVYGDASEIPTTEAYLPYPISPYGIHKLTFEKYLHYFIEVYGLDYTALRFSNVYGPRQYKGGEAGVVSIFVDNAVRDKESTIHGDGKQTRDFVYVGDIVRAFCLAAQSDFTGVVNIGDGVETDLLAMVGYIEEAIGKKIKVSHGAAKIGEQRRSCLSFAKAKEHLGWEPQVDLALGIKKTIEWSEKTVNY